MSIAYIHFTLAKPMAQKLMTAVILTRDFDLTHFEMAAASVGDDGFIHWLFKDADSE
jgi:hypothetical protein